MKCLDKLDRFHISTLPCSVIDIAPQEQRRRKGQQGAVSSRADYSNFPVEVNRLCWELYLRNCSTVFDPFAGWGERAAMAREMNRKYIGYDISPVAIENAHRVYGVENTLADSASTLPPMYDGLLTCPPYWNLEKYSNAGLDSIKTWDRFLIEYESLFTHVYKFASPGAVFCLMVCDWRSKGKYFDLAWHTQRIFKYLGAETQDQLVVSRKGISKIKVMIPQAVTNGYVVKVHESLMVFRKPNGAAK